MMRPELRAAWSSARVDARAQFLRDLAGRNDWLFEICAAACDQDPGLGAAFGRRATEDMRAAWSAASPADRRQFLLEILPAVADATAPTTQPSRHGAKMAEKYKAMDRALSAFLEERTVETFGARLRSIVLYEELRTWSAANGVFSMSQRMMTFRLKQLGLRTIKSNRVWWIDRELVAARGATR